jgi:hypothetical protein
MITVESIARRVFEACEAEKLPHEDVHDTRDLLAVQGPHMLGSLPPL